MQSGRPPPLESFPWCECAQPCNVGGHLLMSLSPFDPSSPILRKVTPPSGNRLPLVYRAASCAPASRDPRRIKEGDPSNEEIFFHSRPYVPHRAYDPRRACVPRRALRPSTLVASWKAILPTGKSSSPRAPASHDPRRIKEGDPSNEEIFFPSRPYASHRAYDRHHALRSMTRAAPCVPRPAPRLASHDSRRT
jgi:hypothetical protein